MMLSMSQDVMRHGELDPVRAARMQKLVDAYHERATRGLGVRLIDGQLVKHSMTRLAVFLGPADEPQKLRPAPPRLGPCVWEAAVLAHERTAFVDHVLTGHGPLQLRLTTWAHDTLAAAGNGG